jgi:hypothetical protein
LQAALNDFNSQALSSAFAASTKASAISAVKAWQNFCLLVDVEWMLTNVMLSQVISILLSYIGFEIGIRLMNPASIKQSYLTHIQNHFTMNRIDNHFASARASSIVKLTLAGYLRIYHLMHPISGARKFAFTIELVGYLQQALAAYKPQWLTQPWVMESLSLAMEFGIYFLLRKSEYLPSGSVSGGLQWKDITFFDYDGLKIEWSCINKQLVKSMQINIGTSKTDQNGIGRIVKHFRVDGPNCIVCKTAKWARICRKQLGMVETDFLFGVRGDEPVINSNTVAGAMKAIVKFLGWKSDKVSPHSLRYGGATMLAAAGLPQYVIEYFGGWAAGSKSLKVYAQLGSAAVLNVSNIMAAGFETSLEESRIRAFANAL